MTPIRILIADDHYIVRRALRIIIPLHLEREICGEAGDGLEALRLVEELKPDIAILDINLPGMNGLQVAAEIRKRLPATEVIMFAASANDSAVRAALQAGVRGFILKTECEQELMSALKAVSNHQNYYSTALSHYVLGNYLAAEGRPNGASLTRRERETVALIAEGKANKEAASSLGLSVKTIETHRARAMRKLKLRSTAELVRYAIREGIIEA